MNILDAFFLGIFQGIVEFLPVSSSGHLVLAEHFFHLNQEKLLPFDVVLHGGTLFALFFVFFTEIKEILGVIFFPKKATIEAKKLFFFLLIATIPVIIAGFLFKDSMDMFRTPQWVEIFFIISAFLFVVAEKFPKEKKKEFSFPMSITVGILQMVALFPGVSRSGTCTAAAMLTGVSREKATRFSFLLGMPVIAGAFLLGILDIIKGENTELPTLIPILVGFFSSAIIGFIMAKFLLQFFKNHSLYGFAIYLLVAAGVSFWFL